MAAVDLNALFAPSNPLNVIKKAFEQEHTRFVKAMKKKNTAKNSEDGNSKWATRLFNLWNGYEKRLPSQYMNEKLVSTGEILVKLQEYGLALHQCFDRYILWIERQTGKSTDVLFKEQYFQAEESNEAKQTELTIRAFLGRVICAYRLVVSQDSRLESINTQNYTISLLETLRKTMTVSVTNEKLSWLTYNGTIYVYTIARSLMSVGLSSKVLEYLLWVANAMESAVALLAVKYLTWRVTLYAAVCQCYYDCKAGAEAEEFARRALNKIHELACLEANSSDADTVASSAAFHIAMSKVNVLIFKRSSFVTRQRPKGVFRSKTKPNYKDAVQLPWPRTQTERLLSDMFDNRGSMLVAVNEALTEVNRRTLITSLPSPEISSDIDLDSVLDVYAELFFAGSELCASALGQSSHTQTPWPGNVGSASVITSALADDIPLGEVLRFIKLLYNYEQWETFLSLVEPVLSLLEDGSSELCLAGTKALQILLAIEDVQSGDFVSSGKQATKRKSPHEGLLTGDLPATEEVKRHHKRYQQQQQQQQQQQAGGEKDEAAVDARSFVDSLLHLANILVSCTREPYASAIQAREMDILIDTCLYLWSCCRSVFQRFMSADEDQILSFLRIDDSIQWLQILCSLYITLTWAGFSTIDVALYSDITLKLALALEGIASLNANSRPYQIYVPAASVIISMLRTLSVLEKGDAEDAGGERGEEKQSYVDGQSKVVFLSRTFILREVEKVVNTGLAAVGAAQDRVKRGSKVADVVLFMKGQSSVNIENHSAVTKALEAANMAALVTEFVFILHRIEVKLLAFVAIPRQPFQDVLKQKRRLVKARSAGVGQEEQLLASCDKNLVSRALLYMQLAVHARGVQRRQMASAWIEESFSLLKQAEQQERRLMSSLALPSIFEDNKSQTIQPTLIPSEPLLVSCNDTSMVLRPAPFISSKGEKVSWYKLYGRVATGPNAKVRLNDYHLPGLEQQVPATDDCVLHVTGLKPNETYMFAVAAYTHDGKLIGSSIGASTRPLLAANYLPLLDVWGFLAQAAYRVGVYHISKHAASVLWDYFVVPRSPPSTRQSTISADLELQLNEIDRQKALLSSRILLRHFVETIFLLVDITVREGGLFCDLVSFQGPCYNMQAERLRACERLLVALELSGHLNDASLCLQVIVQCYGLLVPFIHHRLASQPSILVLMRCHAVLQEFPSATRQFRRTAQSTDHLHHVTATLTYHIAKAMSVWSQRGPAASILDAGKHLLSSVETETGLLSSNVAHKMPCVTPALTSQQKRKKKSQKSGKKFSVIGLGNVQEQGHAQSSDAPKSEDLKALEVVILQLSTGSKPEEQDITGSEDPNVLYPLVATMNAQQAYREVVKFRRRTRFLEFLVRVVQKAFHEGHRDLVLEWAEDALSWLNRRNDTIIAPKVTSLPKGQAVTLTGDPSRYNAAVLEYTKKSPLKASRMKKAEPKRRSPTQLRQLLQLAVEEVDPQSSVRMIPKEDFGRRTSVRSPVFKKADKIKRDRIHSQQLVLLERLKVTHDEIATKAREVLRFHLIDYWRTIQRRRKLRSISNDEMPWRAQLNTFQALSCFSNYLERIDNRLKLTDMNDFDGQLTELDNELFGLETTGSLIVGWKGGFRSFKEQETRHDTIDSNLNTTATQDARTSESQLEPISSGLSASAHDLESATAAVIEEAPTHGVDKEPHTEAAEEPETRVKDAIQKERQAASKPSGKLSTIQKMFLYFRRAIVLSHRGRNWMLLRNTSRCLWDSTQALLSRAIAQSERKVTAKLQKPTHSHEQFHSLTVGRLRSDAWLAFYFAANLLLDMLKQLEEGSHMLILQAMEQKTTQEQTKSQLLEKQIKKTKAKETDETKFDHKDTLQEDLPHAESSTRAKSTFAESPSPLRNVKSRSQETHETLGREGSHSQTTQFTSTLEDSTTLARSATLPFTIHSSTTDVAEDSLSPHRALNPDGDKDSETTTNLEESFDVGSASNTIHTKLLSRPVLVDKDGWYGGPHDEAGGAGLMFEARLDERGVVDLRWVKRIVMQTLQLLFYEGQWEKLAEIALHFNSLTNDRYSEQVTPLLVIAQQQLATRSSAASKLLPSSLEITPGGHIDPTGHSLYDRVFALAHVSVPLNVHSSLQAMQHAISNTSDVSRSLQYCRCLLVRYLGGHSNGLTRLHLESSPICESERSSRLFVETEHNVEAAAINPRVLTLTRAAQMEDVENLPLDSSQVGSIILAYDKTIESLLVKRSDLAAQAMNELGNLHFHLKNIRGAYKCWADGVDTILGLEDGVNEWRYLESSKLSAKKIKKPESTASTTSHQEDCDLSRIMLNRCGVWGCLQAAIMASKISQFIVNSDLSQRLEYCLLSSCLVKSIFRASLPHPQADCEYVRYDIGPDGVASELVPGIDLFSDYFRCNVQSLVAALEWNIEELLRTRYFLNVLPLISFHHYVACIVCRDVCQTVQSRLWRLEALTGLCCFSEAIHVLSELVCGYRLPQAGSSSFLPAESRMTSVKFSNGLPLTDQSNYKVMTQLFKKSLSTSLSSLYGKRLTSLLNIGQARLQITIASTVNNSPATLNPSLYSSAATSFGPAKRLLSKPVLGRGRHMSTKVASLEPVGQGQAAALDHASDVIENSATESPRLLKKVSLSHSSLNSWLETPQLADDKSVRSGSQSSMASRASAQKAVMIVPTMREIKGGLLEEAEKIINIVMQSIIKKFIGQDLCDVLEEIPSSDIELLCHCLLMLSDIANQYDHQAPSSDYVLQAMQLLSDYLSLPDDRNEGLDNVKSTQRLDARLWLRCRLALVHSLDVDTSLASQSSGLNDFVAQCKQGKREAKSLGDMEMWLEFAFNLTVSDWIKFDKTSKAVEGFMEILDRSSRLRKLSPSCQQLVSTSRLFLEDLKMKGPETVIDFAASLTSYRKAEEEVFNLIMTHGESIVWDNLNTTLASLHNIYLPFLTLLSCIKLRIGMCLAHQVVSSPDDLKIFDGTRFSQDTPYLKTPRLAVVHQPSAVSSVMSTFAAGQQHLMIGGTLDGKSRSSPWLIPALVCGAGLDIARVTARQEHQLEAALAFLFGIIERQLAKNDHLAHREAASVILSAISNTSEADYNLSLTHKAYLEIALTYIESINRPLPESLVNKFETTKGKESKTERVRKERLKEFERERQKEVVAAWTAVRSAAQTAKAASRLSSLLGEGQSDDVLRRLEGKEQSNMPTFSKLMLANQSELRFVNITKLLGNVEHTACHHHSITKLLNDIECPQVTWIFLLRYVTHLRSSMSRSAQDVLPEASASPGINHRTLTRLAQMHDFLKESCAPYATKCVAPMPTSALNLPYSPLERLYQQGDGMIIVEPTTTQVYDPSEHNGRRTVSETAQSATVENAATTAGDNEVCIQWYRTPFGKLESILCVYALNCKATRVFSSPSKSPMQVGRKEVSATAFGTVSKQLAELEAQAAAMQSVPAVGQKGRRGTDGGPIVVTAEVKEKFDQIRRDILLLFGGRDVQMSLDCTIINISHLARLFRPTVGAIVRNSSDVYGFFKMLFSDEEYSRK